MKISLLFPVCFIAFTGIFKSAHCQNLETAAKFYSKGDYLQAISLWEEQWKKTQSDSLALESLLDAYARTGRLEKLEPVCKILNQMGNIYAYRRLKNPVFLQTAFTYGTCQMVDKIFGRNAAVELASSYYALLTAIANDKEMNYTFIGKENEILLALPKLNKNQQQYLQMKAPEGVVISYPEEIPYNCSGNDFARIYFTITPQFSGSNLSMGLQLEVYQRKKLVKTSVVTYQYSILDKKDLKEYSLPLPVNENPKASLNYSFTSSNALRSRENLLSRNHGNFRNHFFFDLGTNRALGEYSEGNPFINITQGGGYGAGNGIEIDLGRVFYLHNALFAESLKNKTALRVSALNFSTQKILQEYLPAELEEEKYFNLGVKFGFQYSYEIVKKGFLESYFSLNPNLLLYGHTYDLSEYDYVHKRVVALGFKKEIGLIARYRSFYSRMSWDWGKLSCLKFIDDNRIERESEWIYGISMPHSLFSFSVGLAIP